MKVTLWGTRGSLPTPGPDTVRYGGNTACVEVRSDEGNLLVLDAGTGIRGLGATIKSEASRVDLLLSHLHMDHIQGLGFFGPLLEHDREVHIWGPASTTLDLSERLARYLSPPLFPVRLRELSSHWALHDVPLGRFEICDLEVRASLVCHPGPTVGYRISGRKCSLAYLPDHEPALGWQHFPTEPDWTSGFDIAEGVDVLIHDAQYSAVEYEERAGWGHSAIQHTLAFAGATQVKRLVTFHHDPGHADLLLDQLVAEAETENQYPFELVAGREGTTLEIAE